MLSKELQWLEEHFPNLNYDETTTILSGNIDFVATYNLDNDQFLILFPGVANTIGGVTLSGKYSIKIEKPLSNFQLPRLYVEEDRGKYYSDRHLNGDGTACLCGPLEEANYAKVGLSFPEFLASLVIPFLYGQIYYDTYHKWPWKEYSHGEIGALESYLASQDELIVEPCLKQLKAGKNWSAIKLLLTQKSEIKGHTACICEKKDHIRRCHPEIWRALNKLRNAVKKKVLDIL